jgi:hypothetical protein
MMNNNNDNKDKYDSNQNKSSISFRRFINTSR